MATGRNGRTVRDLRRANRTAVLQRLYFDGPLSRFEARPGDRAQLRLGEQRRGGPGRGRPSRGGRQRRLRRWPPPHPAARGARQRPHDRRRRRRDPGADRAVRPDPHRTRPRRAPAGGAALRGRGHRRPHPRRHRRGAHGRRYRPRAAPRRRHRRPGHRGTHLGPRRCRTRADHRLGRRPAGRPAPFHLPTAGHRPVLHRQRREDPRSGRDVVRRRPRRAQRGRRPVRLRSGRLPRHPRGGARPGRRVGTSDRTGQRAPLPVRCARLPGGVRRGGVPAGAVARGGRAPARGRRRGDRADRDAGRGVSLRGRGGGRGGACRTGGDRRVPGRRAVRPDQSVPARADSHRGWAGLQLGARFLPAVRRHAASYALRHPAERVTIDLGRLGPDAVTVGTAILPLADFFARGGRRPEPAPAGPAPAWQTALEERR